MQETQIRELEHRLTRVEAASPDVYSVLAESLAGALSSPRFKVYELGFTDQGPRIGRYASNVALPERIYRRQFEASCTRADRSLLLYDPLMPDSAQRNRALTGDTLQRLTKHPPTHFFASGLVRSDDLIRDQLRALICDGPVALAWVGVFRPETYTEEEAMALQRLIPSIRARVLDEVVLEPAQSFGNALEAALEHIPAEAWLVRTEAQGTCLIALANTAGRSAYERDAKELVAAFSTLLKGGSLPDWTCTRVRGRAAPEHALLTRRRRDDSSATLTVQAAKRWELTSRQAEVLVRVTRGHANKTIAAELGCSEVNVEYHLTRIFRRVGVTSRAELVAKVWELGG